MSTITCAPSGKQCAAVTKTVGDTSEPEHSSKPPAGLPVGNQIAIPTYGCRPLSGEPLTTANADAASTPAATKASPTTRSLAAFLRVGTTIRPP